MTRAKTVQLKLGGTARLEVREGAEKWIGETRCAFWVWRVSDWYNPRERCVAGPYPSDTSAQRAIDEGRISCRLD